MNGWHPLCSTILEAGPMQDLNLLENSRFSALAAAEKHELSRWILVCGACTTSHVTPLTDVAAPL